MRTNLLNMELVGVLVAHLLRLNWDRHRRCIIRPPPFPFIIILLHHQVLLEAHRVLQVTIS